MQGLGPEKLENGICLKENVEEQVYSKIRNSALDILSLRCLLDAQMEMSNKQLDIEVWR